MPRTTLQLLRELAVKLLSSKAIIKMAIKWIFRIIIKIITSIRLEKRKLKKKKIKILKEKKRIIKRIIKRIKILRGIKILKRIRILKGIKIILQKSRDSFFSFIYKFYSYTWGKYYLQGVNYSRVEKGLQIYSRKTCFIQLQEIQVLA